MENNRNNDTINSPVFPEAPPPYPPVQPVRRIGTFTLGMSLVLLGILVPVALFFGKDAWQLLLLSPAVLLCLGIEILVYAIRFKDSKYKYDGLSVFLVLLITFTTLLGSGVVKAAKSAAICSEQLEQAQKTAAETAENALSASGCTGNVNGYHINHDSEIIHAFLNNARKPDWQIRININLYTVNGNKNPDREQILKAMVDIAKACGKEETITDLSMDFTTDKKTYKVYLSGNSIESTNITDLQSRLSEQDLETSETAKTTRFVN